MAAFCSQLAVSDGPLQDRTGYGIGTGGLLLCNAAQRQGQAHLCWVLGAGDLRLGQRQSLSLAVVPTSPPLFTPEMPIHNGVSERRVLTVRAVDPHLCQMWHPCLYVFGYTRLIGWRWTTRSKIRPFSFSLFDHFAGSVIVGVCLFFGGIHPVAACVWSAHLGRAARSRCVTRRRQNRTRVLHRSYTDSSIRARFGRATRALLCGAGVACGHPKATALQVQVQVVHCGARGLCCRVTR